MTYREEFPDFDPADMPAIPSDWADESWHNDACPSFYVGCDAIDELRIYIDYADPDRREVKGNGRYIVLAGDDSECLLESDDWNAVLRFVNELNEWQILESGGTGRECVFFAMRHGAIVKTLADQSDARLFVLDAAEARLKG